MTDSVKSVPLNGDYSSVSINNEILATLRSKNSSDKFSFDIAIDNQNTLVTAVFGNSFFFSLKGNTGTNVPSSMAKPIGRECKMWDGDVYQAGKSVGTISIYSTYNENFLIYIYMGKQSISIQPTDYKIKANKEYVLRSQIVEPLPCGSEEIAIRGDVSGTSSLLDYDPA